MACIVCERCSRMTRRELGQTGGEQPIDQLVQHELLLWAVLQTRLGLARLRCTHRQSILAVFKDIEEAAIQPRGIENTPNHARAATHE